MEDGLINLDTKLGKIAIPPQMLGWLGIMVAAGFLLYQQSTIVSAKLDSLIQHQQEVAAILQKNASLFESILRAVEKKGGIP